MGILADNGLTPKQTIFADTYVANGFNGVQAARDAGYSGNDATLRAIASENLTKPNIQQYLARRTSHIKVKADKAIIKARDEFYDNLEFARKLRKACVKWLVDPDDPDAFTIDPRASEIDIVYFDGIMQRRERLDVLLSRLEGYGIPNPTPFVKTVDLREYALKAVDKCDVAADKFAKMDGDYSKEKENPQSEADRIKQATEQVIQSYVDAGMPRGEAEALVASVAGVVAVEQVQ